MIKKTSTKIIFSIISLIIIFIAINYGCIYKRLFGIYCPGCGLTRSYKSLIHGDIKQAFIYHPLFWTVPIFGITAFIDYKYNDLVLKVLLILVYVIYIYRLISHTLI